MAGPPPLTHAGMEAADARSGLPEKMLIDTASGSRIELEGNRLPLTHSKDVIDALGG